MHWFSISWVKYHQILGFSGGLFSLKQLLSTSTDVFGVLGAFFGMMIAAISFFRLVFPPKKDESDDLPES